MRVSEIYKQVSMQEARSIFGKVTPNQPMFTSDRTGRTLFYVRGPRFGGYVVPDERCEGALRDAVERYWKLENWFGYILVPPIVVSVWALGRPHDFFPLVVLVATLAIGAVGKTWYRGWCFEQLLVGLERVEPLDPMGGRIGVFLRTLLFGGFGLYVAWRILQALQSNSF